MILPRLIIALAFLPLAVPAAAALPAFPGAEGAGSTTPGGRGGRVLFVTTLADSGPGSFRSACEAEGPRIVVFRVAGTIALRSPINVRNPYLTIAGQSAPGDGVCLRDNTFGISTHDVVVRFLRSRLGDETKREADCIDLNNGARNCILDHCSATWSIDECLSTSGVNADCTIQWCLIGESLNRSKHAKGAHGYGSLARANGPMSWHHNLWIHNDARNPRLGDNYGRDGRNPSFDVRNNVMYGFGGTASGLTQGKFTVNYVGNYLRPGPGSRAKTPITIGTPSELVFHLAGNLWEPDPALSEEKYFSLLEAEGRRQVTLSEKPFTMPPVTTVSAREAYELVLASVGASRPVRDAVDTRLIRQVRDRTGELINSQSEVGGWPDLKSGSLPVDSDNDGIPDAWEIARGLNPKEASDNSRVLTSGYTAIEEYLNELARPTL
jgi:hypothetical protein